MPDNEPTRAATIIQRQAANPRRSVALRASAGSGKTRVLAQRFLRLCLEDGPSLVHPRAILAVTFTRKAAVEIRERLVEDATALALANEADRVDALTKLFGDREHPEPSASELLAAANLLEKILEDTSGLNVGTIHSFCQLILGRFAAEAGLDPHFSVLENQDDLVDEAIELLEREMTTDADLRAAAGVVASNPVGVRKVLHDTMHEQMRLGRWLSSHADAGDSRLGRLPALLADLRAVLFPDLADGEAPQKNDFLPLLTTELAAFADAGVATIVADMGPDLASVNPASLEKLRVGAQDLTARLQSLAAEGPDEIAFVALAEEVRALFLTKQNVCRSYTSARRDPEAKARFIALVAEQALGVLGVVHRLGYIDLYQTNRALLQLTLRLLDIYDELKRRDRVVDFQDLEDLACALMGDEGCVGSLLFRLDDAISHILLDEFQDTNFNQWDMLQPFVREFLSTDDPTRRRTLFMVGDIKQSIYGFRGAEPQIFRYACEVLACHGWPTMNLPTNFRSRRHVVAGVGTLFNTPPLSSALPASELAHVWQEVASEEASVPIQVLAPYAATDDDARSPDQLAAAAAAQVVRQLKNDRKVTNWADVLVLTRSRTEVTLYEQAFRDAGIPFVPAGRGMLGASREVQDILSLLRWLLWPDDDAALATVLRSPLFRLDEATFQQLLGRRALLVPGAKEGTFRTPHTIWRTLRNASGEPIFAPIVELLTGWRKHLGFETVHDLLRRIFREGDVIARYRLARGDQAEYNLLRLYDLALSGEVSGTPTVRRLVDFLTRAAARGGQAEGAVPQGGSAGRVRLMTIHGAKGLEAEVVVMIDANRAVGRESACVKLQPESPVTPLMFKVVQAHRRGYGLPDGVHWPQDPLQRVCAAARDVDCTENANLLYVAMTRAKDRLVVVGADRERGKPDDSPLRQILTGVAACSEPEHFQMDDPAGMTRPPVAVSLPKSGAASLDTVRVWTPPIPRETMRVVTPSAVHDTDGPLTVPGRTEYSDEDPTRRGEQVHLLLQLAADSGRLPVGTSAHHAEAAGVFEVPQLDWVFRPETVGGRGLSEVPVMHRRREPAADGVEERLTGVIDRLVLRPDRVDIVDYKTNRFGGDGTVRSNLVNHYRPQLAGYREAVASMYPGREIHTWLLFTEPGVPDADRLAEVVTT